ncbi:MAG: RNA polymerase sigma factor [Pirellulaceae bacterium]|nr:RNA polymerase sigma factor [Pirellulaceae bacterium]
MPSPDRPSDSDAVSRWVREHGRSVRGYLLGLVRRPDVADDLAQEVFRRAWQARDRYQEQGHERAWLLRIADNLACDRARRQGKERTVDAETWRQLEPADGSTQPDDLLVREESRLELQQALDRLTDAQQRVLLLRYYGEMDFAQIAEVVGCPLSTALSHARRGLLALRKHLAENAS